MAWEMIAVPEFAEWLLGQPDEIRVETAATSLSWRNSVPNSVVLRSIRSTAPPSTT